MLDYPINVTIDTNTFYACKYDLSKDSTLQVLSNYVKDGKVKVYLSNIVLKEAKADLEERSSELYSQIHRNKKEIRKIVDEDFIYSVGLGECLKLPEEQKLKEEMMARFDDYIESLNPIVFNHSQVDLERIVDDYFSFNAPFEHSEKKRKEFPDAFIASQIRSGFPTENSFIISKDKGFKEACLSDEKYVFLDSLGALYNIISEQDKKNYELAKIALAELQDSINTAIRENVINYELITVYGLSHDRKGVVSGYDYSETSLRAIKNVTHKLHVIDDINDGEALITLSCSADIEMDCYYEDYDNAPWDSEEKSYVYVNTRHIIENHLARFGARLRIDLSTKKFELNDVVIFLGGDTRKSRELVVDDDRRRTIGWGEAYDICPDCGCSISHRNDGGNGFCIDCAPNH